MVKYGLVFTKRAVKDIEKIDILVKKKLKEFFEKFKSDPFKYSKKLVNPELGQYRARFGNYRIIFDIVQANLIVLRIGHRKDIYI